MRTRLIHLLPLVFVSALAPVTYSAAQEPVTQAVEKTPNIAATCRNEKKLHSWNSDRATTLTFTNGLSEKVVIYWLNFDGQRTYYQTLAPDEQYTQPTYVTHPWVIANGVGECLQVTLPHRKPSMVVIGAK